MRKSYILAANSNNILIKYYLHEKNYVPVA